MKYQMKGLRNFIERLETISNPLVANAMIERAVHEGARVVDNATVRELESLPVDNRPYVDGKRNGILQVQKDHLLIAFGTSPIDNRKDFINRKTGVDRSVNKLGQPAVTIARRLENGTSYMKKDPVFSRASRKARKQCLDEMQKSLDESYKTLLR